MTEKMDFFDALREGAKSGRAIRFKNTPWRHVMFCSDAIQLGRKTNNGVEYWMPTNDARKKKAWEVEPEPEELFDFDIAFAAARRGDLIAPEGSDRWSAYDTWLHISMLPGQNEKETLSAILLDEKESRWWPSPEQIAGKWRIKPKEEPEEKEIIVWGICDNDGECNMFLSPDVVKNSIGRWLLDGDEPLNLFPKDKPQKFKLVPKEKMEHLIKKLQSLVAKDEQGGFIYRGFEAHEKADKIILRGLREIGEYKLAAAYEEVRREMCFEYGNEM